MFEKVVFGDDSPSGYAVENRALKHVFQEVRLRATSPIMYPPRAATKLKD